MRLDLRDCIIIAAVVLSLAAHAATIFIEARAVGASGLAQAGVSLEANPAQRLAQGLTYLSQFILDSILYGVLLGAYVFFRNRSRGNAERELALWIFATVLFMLAAMDAANDLAYVAALLW